MGMSIDCDENAPIPRNTTLEVWCDGDACGMFPTRATFACGNYAANHAAAMKAGWLERDSRWWLCPGCSGKSAI